MIVNLNQNKGLRLQIQLTSFKTVKFMKYNLRITVVIEIIIQLKYFNLPFYKQLKIGFSFDNMSS